MHKSTQAWESKISYKLGYNSWLENNRVDHLRKFMVERVCVCHHNTSKWFIIGGGGGGGEAIHARSGSSPDDKSSY